LPVALHRRPVLGSLRPLRGRRLPSVLCPVRRAGRSLGPLCMAVALLASLALTGCVRKPWWDPQPQIGNDHSITDGTQNMVPALPGWGGGCYWPFVNLYSGNLVLRQVLFEVPSLGFDWDLVLYYNSTLAGTSGVLGPGWRHSYDMSLQIGVPGAADITALWGDGRSDIFSFDGSGWAGPPELQGRRITTIAGGYELRDKHGMRYEYDGVGQLVRTVDRSGHAATLTYAGGRLHQVGDPSGRSIQFLYDVPGRLIQVQGLPPQPAQFQYDGLNRLIRVIHPYVGDHLYGYDAMDRLVRVEDASGRFTDYEYWLATFAVKDARAVGAHRAFGYDQATLTTSVHDSIDLSTSTESRYTFDLPGRCLSVNGPLGAASNIYSPLNQVLFHTDPAGHTTEYQYDALGNTVKRIRPSIAQVEWTYDPLYNLPLTFTNELGKVWTYGYDPNGNLLQATDPLGNFNQYAYDGLDRLITRTDKDGHATSYGYDPWSNVAQITDAAGHTLQLIRNVRGAVEQVIDQAGNAWLLHRGPQDEIVDVEPPGPFAQYQFTYNAPGFLEAVTDPLGAALRYEYDGLNRVFRHSDPYLQPTQLDRDGTGQVRQVTDALGAVESYVRDLAGRVISSSDPDGGVRSYLYGCCNLLQSIDALGNTADYTYDVDDRLIITTWAGGIVEDTDYDPAARVTRAERNAPGEPPIQELYTYDDANRRIQTQQTHLGRTVDYTPSAAGDVLTVVDNLQPLPLNIGYDVRHLPDNVDAGGVPVISALYDARRRLQSLQFSGSSVMSSYTYDAVGRLATVRNESSTFLATYNAFYNTRGDRVDVSGLRALTATPYQHLLGYDQKRRVTSEQMIPGPPATTYDYDAVDDRAQTNPPFGPLYSYSPGHRLLTGDMMTQLWDPNGSVSQLAQLTRTLQYTYGADGQLTDINDGVQNWHFTHGPGGTLAKVQFPSGSDRWIAVDRGPTGPLRYVELTAPGGAPIRERIYTLERRHGYGASPIAEFVGPHLSGSFRALMSSHDGSIVQSARPTALGQLVADRYFDRFGDVLWQSGGPQPEVGYRAMNAILGLDSLPARLRQLQIMATSGTGIGPRTGQDRALQFYVPNSGSVQQDGGPGADVPGSPGGSGGGGWQGGGNWYGPFDGQPTGPSVQDIFDMLKDYFPPSPSPPDPGGGGIGVEDIFDLLKDHFDSPEFGPDWLGPGSPGPRTSGPEAIADDFLDADPETITRLRWWGAYAAPPYYPWGTPN